MGFSYCRTGSRIVILIIRRAPFNFPCYLFLWCDVKLQIFSFCNSIHKNVQQFVLILVKLIIKMLFCD